MGKPKTIGEEAARDRKRFARKATRYARITQDYYARHGKPLPMDFGCEGAIIIDATLPSKKTEGG